MSTFITYFIHVAETAVYSFRREKRRSTVCMEVERQSKIIPEEIFVSEGNHIIRLERNVYECECLLEGAYFCQGT